MSRRPRRRRNLKSLVNKIISKNVETKYLTNSITGTVLSGSAVIANCTAIGQGTTVSTRTGNEIRSRYIDLTLAVTHNAAGGSGLVRVLLVKSFSGALIQADVPGYNSPVDMTKMVVLKDLLVPVDAQNLQKIVKFKVNLKNWLAHFSGAGASDNTKGGIYLMMSSDVAANAPNYATHYRYWYKDA